MNAQIQSVEDRRAAHRAKAAAIGITPDYISVLVDGFYERIRNDAVLGPIFENAMGENWSAHLETMKQFWRSVALSSGEYSGQPVPAHKRHTQIEAKHFEIWLSLFEDTLQKTAVTQDVTDFFMERARRIAASLQLAIFGIPGLGRPG